MICRIIAIIRSLLYDITLRLIKESHCRMSWISDQRKLEHVDNLQEVSCVPNGASVQGAFVKILMTDRLMDTSLS